MLTLSIPDDLKSGLPELDCLHAELLSLLQNLNKAPDTIFSACYERFVRHAESVFAQEEEWMESLDLPSLQEHREQHASALGALHHLYAPVMNGDTSAGRDVVRRLIPRWLALHMATMDAGLAEEIRSGGRTPAFDSAAMRESLKPHHEGTLARF